MSYKDCAIMVTDLSKCYHIYNKPIDRLKQSLVPRLLNIIKRSSGLYYREFWALRNLNLEVRKGETVGIIGKNGSGKSTLLHLICGTLTPTSGEIKTNGRITALLELGSGFNPEFTGRENIFLNGAILGLTQEEIENHFNAIANFADIGEFIERPVKFYSSGMVVRLAFAVQAMVDPDILIVDEALAVGDERFQRKCFRRLEELKENGTSILFVSHSGQQIKELCDKALLIDQGQRIILADPLTVVRAYQQIIYANPDEQIRLVQYFKDLDESNERITFPVPSEAPIEREFFPNVAKYIQTDFFENDLIPTTTTIYPTQGAKIESIKIFNSEMKEVNNLLAGQEYVFEIQGLFMEEREAIYIAFGIRSLTGSVVSHQVYPGTRQYIYGVKSGQFFKFSQKLKIVLTPNTYFAGCGIWSTTEPAIMHKIVDAIMFKVLPRSENQVSGYVDLTQGAPEFELFYKSK